MIKDYHQIIKNKAVVFTNQNMMVIHDGGGIKGESCRRSYEQAILEEDS